MEHSSSFTSTGSNEVRHKRRRPEKTCEKSTKAGIKKLLDQTVERTEKVTTDYCDNVKQYIERWESRLQDVIKNKPPEIVPESDEEDDPIEETSSVVDIPFPDDETLLHFLTISENDALEWIGILRDIELWIILRTKAIDGSFGGKIQRDMITFLNCFVAAISEDYSMKTAYMNRKAEVESWSIKHKYCYSGILSIQSEMHKIWEMLETHYRSLHHKTLLLYTWLRDREAKLVQPVDVVGM
eukprot:TRINITY_DN20282_c0_g1_i1.p1 TRINITY_DN20282_c0_g1~~TRINITY_DN20282_c0_g1_i1.p1  ORF type:complete len:241 (+),score=45.55 TRINITY_DN20282_c0_g1_i1:62-784(+)